MYLYNVDNPAVYIMKRKFEQGRSTILPTISTKRTITSHLEHKNDHDK